MKLSCNKPVQSLRGELLEAWAGRSLSGGDGEIKVGQMAWKELIGRANSLDLFDQLKKKLQNRFMHFNATEQLWKTTTCPLLKPDCRSNSRARLKNVQTIKMYIEVQLLYHIKAN